MIYQTETEAVHAKGKDDVVGVEVKFIGSPAKKSKNKNFENVNFRPVSAVSNDESRQPLRMSDMYGETIVDEYPDGDYDDEQPIIPHMV